MSNPDPHPTETVCEDGPGTRPEVLTPRDVPLGGPRAMTVRRTLPQKERSLIGAWCFLDHYGPDDVQQTGGMDVARHPHTGLATVSWMFTGEIDHLDSTGGQERVRPGLLALMTAGRGITHQEISSPETTVLHGAQLWYALPDAARHGDPGLQVHVPDAVDLGGATARVFIGSLSGVEDPAALSPVETRTAGLLGAEVVVDPGAEVVVTLEPGYEHGILLDTGELAVDDEPLEAAHLLYLPTGREAVVLTAGDAGARLLLLGGVPFGEQIVMWWNFVGRSHEEVAAYRARYQAEIGADESGAAGVDGAGGGAAGAGTASAPVDGVPDDAELFGPWPAGQPAPLPAPRLPGGRLRPRG